MYELFRYVVFTKSPFFQKTAIFFIIFPKKQPFFATRTRNFQSFFEKQPHFSRKIPKIHFFVFSKTSRNKDHFSTIQPHRRQHPRRAVRKCGGRRNPEKFRCTVIFVTISCYNSVINLYLYALFRNKKKHHSY